MWLDNGHTHTHMNKLFKILGKTVLENDSCVLS